MHVTPDTTTADGTGSGVRADVEATPPALGYAEVVSAFAEVAGAISGDERLDTLLHLVAERICALLGIRRCSVYLRESDAGVFRGQVAHAVHDIDVAIKRLTAGVEADGFTREILRTQRPVLIDNAQSDVRPVRAAMVAWNVRAMLGVPMVLRGRVLGLLFLDNEDVPHDYTPDEQELCQTFANLAAIAISQSQLTAELRGAASTAAQQNAVLRRAAALEDRLSDLVMGGANLAEIARAVTELTGKSAAVHDAELRRLAHAETEGDAGRGLTPALAHEPVVRDALGTLTGRKPIVIPAAPALGLAQRCLVAAVRVDGQDWGYLVLREGRSRFGAQDMIVARRTATIVALEMSGRHRAEEAETHAVEALVRDLVLGAADGCALRRRADYHGLAHGEPHMVVLVGGRGTSGRPTAPAVRNGLARLASGHQAFTAGVEEGVVVVLRVAGGQGTPEETGATRRLVERLVEDVAAVSGAGGPMSAAISAPCDEVEGYPAAFEEARRILHGIETFGAPDRHHVHAAEELGVGKLLLATDDRRTADRFVEETLGWLLDEDSPGARDLLRTLQAFFACSRSVRRSAVVLGVHENTIRYRLARMEELSGQDVAGDADAQLAVQLALLVLRLEDRLSPLPVGGRIDTARAFATEP